MDQFERNKVINAFRKQEMPTLVATDVAGTALVMRFTFTRLLAKKCTSPGLSDTVFVEP